MSPRFLVLTDGQVFPLNKKERVDFSLPGRALNQHFLNHLNPPLHLPFVDMFLHA